jgi:trimeric autotransporter adhesin
MKLFYNTMLFFSIIPLFGQVGINTTSPNSLLEIRTSDVNAPQNTDGLLIPKVNLFPATNPGTNQDGMLVYLTTTQGLNLPGFYYWHNATTQWLPLGKNTGWSISGNENTDAANHFIGTTDDVPINFRVNNIASGTIEEDTTVGNTSLGFQTLLNNTGVNNTAFGYSSLINNTTGYENTAIGRNALSANTTGFGNVAVGFRAALNLLSGYENVAVGKEALENDINGIYNVAIGFRALRESVGGSENTALGVGALEFGQRSTRNTAVGRGAMFRFGTSRNNTAIGYAALASQSFLNGGTPYGSNNTAIGYEAMYTNNPTSISNGIRNVAVGFQSLRANTIGYGNTSLGFQNMLLNTIGFQNVALGDVALASNINGNRNVAVGTGSMYGNTTASNNVAVGYDALRIQSFDNGGTAYVTGNVAVGSRALRDNQPTASDNGNRNVAIGLEALRQNTIGAGNTAVGFQSLLLNTTGIRNVGLGDVALASNTIGSQNIGIGVGAAYENTTASNNIAIGVNALRLQSFNNGGVVYDTDNVAIGTRALFSNQPINLPSGRRNVAIGTEAMYRNTISNTIAIGYRANYNNTSHGIFIGTNAGYGHESITSSFNNNIGIGDSALQLRTTGYGNVALGHFSMQELTTGRYNVAVGLESMNNYNGSYTVALGYRAGFTILPTSLASGNIFIGPQSGSQNGNGIENIFIGVGANAGNPDLTNATAIGSNSIVSTSNSLALGGMSGFRTRVGINNSAPIADLDIRQTNGLGSNQGDGGINFGNGVYHWRIYNSSNFVRFNYSNDSGTTYTPLAYVSATNGSWNQLSDASLKENILPLENTLDKLEQIKPVSYRYRYNSAKDSRSIGFLAQDIAQVFPELVSRENESELMGIDYAAFSVIAIKAIQEQQEIIQSQDQKIYTLEQRLQALEEKLNKE